VIGIDLIPAQPPKGVSTFQGDFLSPMIRQMVKNFIVESHRRQPAVRKPTEEDEDSLEDDLARPSYIDMERHASHASEEVTENKDAKHPSRLVDVSTTSSNLKTLPLTHLEVVLSDMSAPWDQTTGFSVNTLSNPYRRLMNTSGMPFRDHAGSMVSCHNL
jgi:21S rRNA (uridine2791-2'-O)-methyltransferase